MSISSGALACMRKAISKELMRVAISGSPTSSSRIWLSCLDASRASRAAVSASTPRRVGEVQDRVAAAAELHALVDGGQEAAAPVGVAAAGPFACPC